MIRDLSIKNYRCFEDFYVDGLAQVNLIVGDNNSGKTSLLEAIYLLVNQSKNNNEQVALVDILEHRFEFIGNNTKQTSQFIEKYIFNNLYYGYNNEFDSIKAYIISISSSQEQSIKLTINLKNLHSSSSEVDMIFKEIIGKENQFYRRIDYSVREYVSYNNANKKMKVFYRKKYGNEWRDLSTNQINEIYRGFHYPCNCNFLFNDQQSKYKIDDLWDSIILEAKEDKIIEALQIIDPNIEKIHLPIKQIPRFPFLKIKGINHYIPINSMGQGISKILILGMLIIRSENGVLLIDEIETGLHYKAQTDMWRLLIKTAQELNVQIFATTHSWDCICAFQEALEDVENKSVGKLFRLDSKYGKLRAVEYKADEVSIAVNQGIEVR
ncbi:MAG: AAA family ATPase [Crocosphaera sp.]|nr:AAA family ATPase [Crocosphaera sp.]